MNLSPSTVKFVHIRAKDENGSLLAKGGLSCGWQIDTINDVIRFAFAQCPTDKNFNKRVARNVITGRLAKNKVQTLSRQQVTEIIRHSKQVSLIFKEHKKLDFELSELSCQFINSLAVNYAVSVILKKVKANGRERKPE